jgi:ketosteroid isomerase-like protein
MPSEDVERLQAVYREWARGNFRAGQDLLAPDVTFVTFEAGSGKDLIYHGPAGVASWMRGFLATWRDLRIQANDFLEVEDRVLVLCHQRAEGRQSGVKVEMPVFAVWTFRDGQVVRLHWLRGRAEAFRTAGLVE